MAFDLLLLKRQQFLSKIVSIKNYKIFLALFFIKFAASFNYGILNSTKDTIIVTVGGGAELIPVLKGGLVLVMAFLAMLVFGKLTNVVAKAKLFYIVIAAHILYFLLFGLFLFPYKESLIPCESVNKLLEIFGSNHKHWIYVYKYWMNSFFFVGAELWGGLVIMVLFWGYANYITSIKEAAKLYGMYAAGGHLGAMFAGLVLRATAQGSNFNALVAKLMVLVFFVGLAMMLVFKLMLQVTDSCSTKANFVLKQPLKLSLVDSVRFLCGSRYLWLIAVMVIGYSLSVNLVEVTWKAILRIRYPDAVAYQQYLGNVQIFIGTLSLLLAFMMSRNLVSRYGWHTIAQVTPVLLTITSICFFTIYFWCPGYADEQNAMLSFSLPSFYGFRSYFITPLTLLIFFGALHNVTCKALKYSIFDPTKEMAYIPLDAESKFKGKAAVDLVGSRFGKSGASWLQLLCIDLVGTGSVLGVTYLLAPCVLFMVMCWLFAVYKLNNLFAAKQTTASATNSFAV